MAFWNRAHILIRERLYRHEGRDPVGVRESLSEQQIWNYPCNLQVFAFCSTQCDVLRLARVFGTFTRAMGILHGLKKWTSKLGGRSASY